MRQHDPLKRTGAELFIEVLGTLGLNGDRAAIAKMLDRAEGRAPISMNINEASDGVNTLIEIFQAQSRAIGPPDDEDSDSDDLPALTEGDSSNVQENVEHRSLAADSKNYGEAAPAEADSPQPAWGARGRR